MVPIFGLILFWLIFDIPYMIFRFAELLVPLKTRKLTHYPLVTILVPAYNEEQCIARTLYACITQTYPNLEIIVIDDGSSDNTSQIVEEFQNKYAAYLNKHKILLKLIRQTNQGKARAMNTGLESSRGEFVLTIDADSYPKYDALIKIMKYFVNDSIGAVAGNIIGVPRKKLLHYLQYVEYEFGILFMKIAQSATSDVTVTPGPFSIYRRTALKRFEEGTITEDFDTTIRILERGYRVVEGPDALCYTQLPQNCSELVKQRVRWYKGGLQVFAKHYSQSKRPSAHLEMVFLFFFGFYGLFIRMASFIIIPTMFFVGVEYALYAILAFFLYSFFIIFLQFIPVYGRLRDKKIFLVIPLFVVYFYTIILYACIVGQIQIFKDNTNWDKLKRYDDSHAVSPETDNKRRWSLNFEGLPYLKTFITYCITAAILFIVMFFVFQYLDVFNLVLILVASMFIALTFRPLYLISFFSAYFMFFFASAWVHITINSDFTLLFIYLANMLWNTMIMIQYIKANYSLELYRSPEEEIFSYPRYSYRVPAPIITSAGIYIPTPIHRPRSTSIVPIPITAPITIKKNAEGESKPPHIN